MRVKQYLAATVLSMVLIFGVMLTLFFISEAREKGQNDEVHIHAGFQVFIDGQLQNYDRLEYMKTEPCGDHGHKLTAAEEQLEKAHLHDSIGDVVHVHRVDARWYDLFTNSEIVLPTDKPLTVYVGTADGQVTQTGAEFLASHIETYQSVAFVYGEMNSSGVPTRVGLDHIKETEQRSENCGAK